MESTKHQKLEDYENFEPQCLNQNESLEEIEQQPFESPSLSPNKDLNIDDLPINGKASKTFEQLIEEKLKEEERMTSYKPSNKTRKAPIQKQNQQSTAHNIKQKPIEQPQIKPLNEIIQQNQSKSLLS